MLHFKVKVRWHTDPQLLMNLRIASTAVTWETYQISVTPHPWNSNDMQFSTANFADYIFEIGISKGGREKANEEKRKGPRKKPSSPD